MRIFSSDLFHLKQGELQLLYEYEEKTIEKNKQTHFWETYGLRRTT